MSNVLITGSSTGMGRLTAESLVRQGHTVFATMIGLETSSSEPAAELKTFAEDQPGKIHILEMDVTSDESVDFAVRRAVDLEGHIDVAVNNAGIGGNGWSEAFTINQMRMMFEVNVFGVQRVMRAVLPEMRAQKHGLVVNVTSLQGRTIIPFAGPYTASKYAAEGLSESYHYELARYGVDVVIVEPGGFGTKFEAGGKGPEDLERVETYAPDQNAYHEIMGDPHGSRDFLPSPQPVADAIVNLIELPKGERPLRTVVDPLLGGQEVEMVNKASAEAQKQLREKLGF